jgi:hypothetical protein
MLIVVPLSARGAVCRLGSRTVLEGRGRDARYPPLCAVIAAWWIGSRPRQDWAICAHKANCNAPSLRGGQPGPRGAGD